MILLVASNKDIASLNIQRQILNNYPFKKTGEIFSENPVYEVEINGKETRLVTLNEESVYAQNLTNFFTNPELVVFISRHSSGSGTPTLSVHTPGNLGEAELGGLPRQVSVSPTNAMRDFLKNIALIKGEMQLQYEICYECTHHGPSLNVPTMFAELGSSQKQWSDMKAAEAIAHAVINTLEKFGEVEAKTVIGIGGPHYNYKFTRIALEKEIAFGHIIPKYAVSYVDTDVLKLCVAKTLEKVECAFLDWKGINGEDKLKVVKMLKDIELTFEKI